MNDAALYLMGCTTGVLCGAVVVLATQAAIRIRERRRQRRGV